jgi:hypothetical protein
MFYFRLNFDIMVIGNIQSGVGLSGNRPIFEYTSIAIVKVEPSKNCPISFQQPLIGFLKQPLTDIAKLSGTVDQDWFSAQIQNNNH